MPQRRTSGVKMRSPVTSPSHQVTQIAPYFVQSAKPYSARLATPNSGLRIALIAAASANLKTPCGRSKTFLPPAKWFTSHAAAMASNVLPVAMGKIDGGSRGREVYKERTNKNRRPRSIPSKSIAPARFLPAATPAMYSRATMPGVSQFCRRLGR